MYNRFLDRANMSASMAEDVLVPELRSPLSSGMRHETLAEKLLRRLTGRK